MSKLGKNILKNEAKKIYKENTKNIPKKNRLPFAQFFKKYREMKRAEAQQKDLADVVKPEGTEDFNFDDMVNVNKDLQVEEAPVGVEASVEEKQETKE